VATPTDPAYRAHLQALGDKFAASVPQRMGEIAGALAAAGSTPGLPQLEALHAALHTVAGSAGSFGHAALGDEARRLEQVIRLVMDGQLGWPEIVPQVKSYLSWAAKGPRRATYEPHD
jgi:HPt (histidine-containing phosphotransfer) domain-containing protein